MMKTTNIIKFAFVAGFVFWAAPALLMASSEKKLSQEGEKIDEVLNSQPGDKAGALAKTYDVPRETVENIRGDHGWGETSIQLSLAKNLTETNPDAYPDMETALGTVTSLRAEGKGYGVIAKELGFKLGPVVSDARRVRKSFKKGIPAAKPAHGASPKTPPGHMKRTTGPTAMPQKGPKGPAKAKPANPGRGPK